MLIVGRGVALVLALQLCAACAPAPAPRLEAIPTRQQSAAQVASDRAACAEHARGRVGTERDALVRGGTIGLVIGGFLGGTLGALLGGLAWMAAPAAIYGTLAGAALGATGGGTASRDTYLETRERAVHACLEDRGYVLRERGDR